MNARWILPAAMVLWLSGLLAADDQPAVPVTVAGHLCETGDVFGKDVRMAAPRPGDVLAVLGAGAYSRSMASNYNLRPIPAELLL